MLYELVVGSRKASAGRCPDMDVMVLVEHRRIALEAVHCLMGNGLVFLRIS